MILFVLAFLSCSRSSTNNTTFPGPDELRFTITPLPKGSWQHFLQNLSTKQGLIVDYRGEPVSNQGKAAAIVDYDIGNKDLQQCADVLIRLRAEYLFLKQRYRDIAFQFISGQRFAFEDYCKGLRPVVKGSSVRFADLSAPCQPSHQNLRRYLDIVYAYAGTISLAKELYPVSEIGVGTVIMKSGSPGHCCMVVDEAVTPEGEKLFKLAEGFMPAQSIYILKNKTNGTCWYRLDKDHPIQTASYHFTTYKLYSFEKI